MGAFDDITKANMAKAVGSNNAFEDITTEYGLWCRQRAQAYILG